MNVKKWIRDFLESSVDAPSGVEGLSTDGLEELVYALDLLKPLTEDARKELAKRAESGEPLMAYELCTRRTRKFNDPAAALEALEDEIDSEDLYEYKLKSVSQIEKEWGVELDSYPGVDIDAKETTFIRKRTECDKS